MYARVRARFVAQDCWEAGHGTRAAMGSWGMFSRALCESCDNSSFINDYFNWGSGILCPDCANKERIEHKTEEIVHSMPFHGLGKDFNKEVLGIISKFCVGQLDGDAIFRGDYLRCMLLGPPVNFLGLRLPWATRPMVAFRNFTYASNGIAGNISDNEDIIDRIIGYVVGPREGRWQ